MLPRDHIMLRFTHHLWPEKVVQWSNLPLCIPRGLRLVAYMTTLWLFSSHCGQLSILSSPDCGTISLSGSGSTSTHPHLHPDMNFVLFVGEGTRESMSSKGVAIVTGAARGIGRAIATQLADDGFDVAMNDLDNMRTELDIVAKDIESKGRRSLVVLADVSSEADVKAMVDQVVQKLGSLEVMVANAGVLGRQTGIVDTTVEFFDRVLAINARGLMLCYKHAAIQMIAQGRGGRIIGASSGVGKQACADEIPYVASKFAVSGMTRGAALELAKHNITVNAYAPGPTITPMLDDAAKNNGLVLEEFRQRFGNIPLLRPGQPQDIANLVSFLASEKAGYITGQNYSVDGGLHE